MNRFLHNGPPLGSEFKPSVIGGIKGAQSIDVAVSYLQMSGWFMLQRDLAKVPAAQVRIVTTDQLNITQPAVLKHALNLGVRIKCYSGSRVFHPKVYLFHGLTKSKDLAILGSANISASGLENGVEVGVQISDPAFFKKLSKWFDSLFRDTDARNIDGTFIADYERRWKRAAQTRVELRRISAVRPNHE